jgi:hypothetical protein
MGFAARSNSSRHRAQLFVDCRVLWVTSIQPNMKSNILTISTFLTGIAAVALVPFSATAASMAFTAAGLLSVFLADYGSSVRPSRSMAQVVAFRAPQLSLAEAA